MIVFLGVLAKNFPFAGSPTICLAWSRASIARLSSGGIRIGTTLPLFPISCTRVIFATSSRLALKITQTPHDGPVLLIVRPLRVVGHLDVAGLASSPLVEDEQRHHRPLCQSAVSFVEAKVVPRIRGSVLAHTSPSRKAESFLTFSVDGIASSFYFLAFSVSREALLMRSPQTSADARTGWPVPRALCCRLGSLGPVAPVPTFPRLGQSPWGRMGWWMTGFWRQYPRRSPPSHT